MKYRVDGLIYPNREQADIVAERISNRKDGDWVVFEELVDGKFVLIGYQTRSIFHDTDRPMEEPKLCQHDLFAS
jgi:hypothetical protein